MAAADPLIFHCPVKPKEFIMKNRIFLTRAVIASLLSTSFLVFPFRLSAVAAAPAPIKTESQYRAEALRYDNAIRAIAGILTMKLETSDDLKAALNIVEQHRQNLKFSRSKLIVLALGNSTFSTAVKRKMPTKEEATAFITSLSADRTKVSTVGGFNDLQTQLKKSMEADAGVLTRASDRLKTAAERLKAALNPDRTQPRLVKASFISRDEAPTYRVPQDPLTIIAVAYAVIIVIGVVVYGAGVIVNASTDEGRDEVAECQDRADANYARCSTSPDFFTRVGCGAVLLAQYALCLGNPNSVR